MQCNAMRDVCSGCSLLIPQRVLVTATRAILDVVVVKLRVPVASASVSFSQPG
jgi:hypothetical protein